MNKRVLKSVLIDGKTYAQGVHDFSEKALEHPHFEHFHRAGYIVDQLEDEKPKMDAAAQAKLKEMSEKFTPKRAEKKAEEPVEEQLDLPADEEPKPEKSKTKNKKG